MERENLKQPSVFAIKLPENKNLKYKMDYNFQN